MSVRLRLGCEFEYDSAAEVPMLVFVRPHADNLHHTLYESRWTSPSVAIHEYRDTQNNDCWRLTAPPGQFTLRYDALVEVSGEPDPVVADAPLIPVQDLPDDSLVFTLASRYVQSDLLSQEAWDLFGNTPPSWQRVQAVCDWVHQNVRYETGNSNPSITAVDVYDRRVGVCRDFALLAVAFCRALNIPARYTFGYLPDIAVDPPELPMDFHAWFEAYLGGQWHAFDARHNVPRIGRVVIARGRDAVDVAMSTSYGSQRLERMTVWAEEVTAAAAEDNDADELEAVERRGA
jgi:transglutaminase-like putative cysteine protease